MLTDKQEKYVQGLLKGLSQREAYHEAYPKSKKWKDTSVDSKASTLLSNVKVKQRFDQLKGKAMEIVERRGLLDAADVLEKIRNIIVANEEESPQIALKGLELYGKHLKLFTDKVEHSGKIEMPSIKIGK